MSTDGGWSGSPQSGMAVQPQSKDNRNNAEQGKTKQAGKQKPKTLLGTNLKIQFVAMTQSNEPENPATNHFVIVSYGDK